MPTNVPPRTRAGQQTARPRTSAPAEGVAPTQLPAVIRPFQRQFSLDRTKVDLIKRIVCPRNTSDDELALFLHECARRGCHPMDRLIVMVKFKSRDDDEDGDGSGKPVLMTTIDYLRAQAMQYDTYAGSDRPQYGPTIKVEVSGKERKQPWKLDVPEFAVVAVFKIIGGTRVKVAEGIARWSEFYPGSHRGKMWRQFPFLMLAKCAEAQALRKAYPQRLGRLYVREELDQGMAADEAKVVGRGRSRGLQPEPQSPPPPEGIDDIKGDDVDVALADRWTVGGLAQGESKQDPGKPLWQLTALNGEDEERKFYTRDPDMMRTLESFQNHRTIFTLTAERHASGYLLLVEIAPLTPATDTVEK